MIDITDKMFDLSVAIHLNARKAFWKEPYVSQDISTRTILMITNPVEKRLDDMVRLTSTNSLIGTRRYILKLKSLWLNPVQVVKSSWLTRDAQKA
jgi:hypothetical protein